MRKVFTAVNHFISPKEQTADFVELFFDLVFVYAITQVTTIVAHDLDIKHALQAALVFWMIWWAWTLFTASLNAANTRIAEIRLIVLLSTGVAFVMASSTSEAFSDGVLWFAVPYIIIRVLGIGLYFAVTASINQKKTASIVFGLISCIGFTFIIIGCSADPSQRMWWWLGAMFVDLVAAGIGGRIEGWNLHPKHFTERHGLIVIIALGESLIVAASAISGQERSQELLIVGSLAVLVTCLLWWSYFAWISEHLEQYFEQKTDDEKVRVGRDTFSIIHFPLIAGIIGMAVGFEKILGHPDELLSMPVAIALGGGYLFYMGFTGAAVWRASGMILIPRTILVSLAVLGVLLSVGQAQYLSLLIVSISLTMISLVEWKKCRHL